MPARRKPNDECSHGRTLTRSWSTLEDTAKRVQDTWIGRLERRRRQRRNGIYDNSKETSCPQRVDCGQCFCISCDYTGCLTGQRAKEANQNHVTETGHTIGCCSRYGYRFLFCLKCGTYGDNVRMQLRTESLKRALNRPAGNQFFKRKAPRKPEKILFSEKPFPTVYSRGLVNFGQTCYVNCIIQVLVHIPLISNFFIEARRKLSTRKRLYGADADITFLSIFQQLLQEFHVKKPEPICATKLLCFIWEKMPNVGGNMQHDAHEFFISTVNILHQEFIKPYSSRGTKNPPKSLMEQVFLGRLQSQVTCTVCEVSRCTDDPFLEASIEVISEEPCGTTIELCDLLKSFTRLEYLDDSNMLHCAFCHRKTQSTKQIGFKVLPPILCIQLKRFRHDAGFSFTKITTKVHSPEYMDFSPYKANRPSYQAEGSSCFSSDRDMYQLYAIVSHSGTCTSGHYKTYIRKRSYWYAFDDQQVRRVSSKEALESEGYLLFYRKGSPFMI